jgi:hypothetical protein
VLLLASTAGDVAYYALAAALVALGVASAYMFVRLGQLFERVSSLVRGTERDALPVIVKAGGTVDRVNYQMDKLDSVTDSAVDMADSADTAVRAVSTAITTPVEKAAGVAAYLSHGFAKLRRSRDVGAAHKAASEAKSRREADLRYELREAGKTPVEEERPEPAPMPDPWPKPTATPRPEPVPKPPPAPVPPEEQTAATPEGAGPEEAGEDTPPAAA